VGYSRQRTAMDRAPILVEHQRRGEQCQIGVVPSSQTVLCRRGRTAASLVTCRFGMQAFEQ